MSRNTTLLKVAGIECREKGKNCKKTELNVAKNTRKISQHLVPATFSTIKVSEITTLIVLGLKMKCLYFYVPEWVEK